MPAATPAASRNCRFNPLNIILFQLPSKKGAFGELGRFAGRETMPEFRRFDLIVQCLEVVAIADFGDDDAIGLGV